MEIKQKDILTFQTEILSWYEKQKRDLPWRKTRDSYKILVSEVMLQQTQVSRVIPKYKAWLEAFPTVAALASAKTSDVLRLWSGLGYNRRALNLQKTALIISKEHKGIWPREVEQLKKLPGIGEYTARAVLCFAFGEQIAVVDTNVRRVILTHLAQNYAEPYAKQRGKEIASVASGDLAMTEKEIQEIADRLLPRGKAYEWNQALMDYSAAILKKEKIQIPKQSRFIGSNRYYRGKILKTLLVEKAAQKELLRNMIGLEDENLFDTLLTDLVKEGFIMLQGNKVKLE